jgi:ADP-heptose:LPS heptosyltransferase
MDYKTIKIGANTKTQVALFCNAGLGNLVNFTPVVAYIAERHICDVFVVNNQVPEAPLIFDGHEGIRNIATCLPEDIPTIDLKSYHFIITSRFFKNDQFDHDLVFGGSIRHDCYEAFDNFKAVIKAYKEIYDVDVDYVPPTSVAHNSETDYIIPDNCIGLHCGWGGNREIWERKGYKRWDEVAEILWSYGYKTATFGTEPDRQGWEDNENNIDFIGKLSILELGPVVKQVKYFASANSGLSHYAAAIGLDTLTLFGPTRDVEDRPFSNKATILRTNHCPHSPCKFTPHWEECNEFICMNFDPKEVAGHILEHSGHVPNTEIVIGTSDIVETKEILGQPSIHKKPKKGKKNILFICPGGQTLYESPSEQLALLVAKRAKWDIAIWNTSLGHVPDVDIESFDLIWGDMDGGDVPSMAVDIAMKAGKPCYIHGEWVPPYRVEEGWEEEFNTKTQLQHRDQYIRNLDAMKKADLVSLALGSTPGGFDWISETLGYSFDSYFVRYPACKKYNIIKSKRKMQIATIARANDPKKRVMETLRALSMMQEPPEFSIIGSEDIEYDDVVVNNYGVWNNPDKVKLFSESIIAVQHWSGIPPAEAIQQKCPVIGFKSDYMVELYGDSIDWVPQGDVEALKDKIEEWVNKTQKERNKWAIEKKKKFLANEYGVKLEQHRADLVINKLKGLL